MADFASCVSAKRQSAAPMALSKKCMWVDEIEQSLLEEFTASNQISSSDDDVQVEPMI
jgi:hypothetical protein